VGGELTRDRGGDERARLAALLEVLPALMEAAGAVVGAGAYGRGLVGASPLEGCARSWRSALVPGGLD
jgi:hypothetical protein